MLNFYHSFPSYYLIRVICVQIEFKCLSNIETRLAQDLKLAELHE